MSRVGNRQLAPSRTKFPAEQFARAEDFCRSYLGELELAARSVDPEEVARAARMLMDAYQQDAVVFTCGNGGSAAVANHLQCDHVKGVRTETDLTTRVISLSTNPELITAIANDIGYDEIFCYQLESAARPGDVLVAVSSSGRSPNVVRALRWARSHQVRTIAMTGFDGGEARTTAEVGLHVESANYGVIEDLHQALMHALAQFIRQSRMSPEAVADCIF